MGQTIANDKSSSTQKGYCPSCGKESFADAFFCTYCGAPWPRERGPAPQKPVDSVFEVKKIGTWSLVKFVSMAYALLGLGLGLFFAAIGALGLPIDQIAGLEGFGAGASKGMIVTLPILFGIMGAFTGLSMGMLYNILAWGLGGIRITLKGGPRRAP